MRRITFITFLLIISHIQCQNSTKIIGVVNNIDTDTLVIAKSHLDLRYNGIKIPVRGGEVFKLTLNHNFIEEYAIVYSSELNNGAWRPIIFFPNGKLLELELYPTIKYDKNKVIGDKLLKAKQKYQDLFIKKFLETGNTIYGKIFKLDKGSEAFKETKMSLDSLNKEVLVFQYNHFLDDKSILGLNEYVNLLQSANQMMIPIHLFKKYQLHYLKSKSNHPLIERANNLYLALSKIKKGELYVDINLRDKEDKLKTLSSLITKYDFTLLDLWSPWCGPCIEKSKILKKHYLKISKHINIIGVVGGVNKTNKAIKAINHFDYPWENYLEISDENKIWEKYGIANSGGAQFLINNKGEIVAINPKFETLIKLIEEHK